MNEKTTIVNYKTFAIVLTLALVLVLAGLVFLSFYGIWAALVGAGLFFLGCTLQFKN